MKIDQASRIFTIEEMGKQYALCRSAKGEEVQLAKYKLPLESQVGSRLYLDDFSMYKIIKEN